MIRSVSLGRLCERAGLEPQFLSAGARDVRVTGVAYDSRSVKAGELFVAIKGERFDGATFAADARSRGASAVVAGTDGPDGFGATWIRVDEPRVALARLANAFYDDPSRELIVVGLTGTNGKTTTTYLIEAMLQEAGVPCGRVSSVSYRVGGEERTAERTTPEASDLQAMMRTMVDDGCRGCVMEVSSHALDLHRVEGIKFGAAVFTNLTRDHLDYHGDMSRYFAAKRQLFEMLDDGVPAILNTDDQYGRVLAESVSRPVTYAIESRADVTPDRLVLSLDGMEIDVRTPRGPLRLRSRLLGRFNAYNVLAAAATGAALSLPFRAIERGLASVEHVPGRMEVVSSASDDVTVLVDFAHTDDALKGLLEAARSLTQGRIITVFGCGGDRDKSKRSLMGAVAGRLSDVVVITSDNPRSEDPASIARDIESGLTLGSTAWVTVLDRAEAIAHAIHLARAGDLVVVAGKGHERYQIVGSRALPFEDAKIAQQTLGRRHSGSRVG